VNRRGEGIGGRKWRPVEGDGYLASLKTEIRAELRADGCTQKDLAWYLGISEKHVSQMLTGKVDGRFDLIERMAAAVGLSPEVTRGQR
jgi:transcriptional regulator with XRE-family HTH domain